MNEVGLLWGGIHVRVVALNAQFSVAIQVKSISTAWLPSALEFLVQHRSTQFTSVYDRGKEFSKRFNEPDTFQCKPNGRCCFSVP